MTAGSCNRMTAEGKSLAAIAQDGNSVTATTSHEHAGVSADSNEKFRIAVASSEDSDKAAATGRDSLMTSCAVPRVLIAAPGSGSGKTLITCALLKALKKHGMDVRAFKCGPDYIDPMFHRTVIGVPSENLDLFFTGEEQTREIFRKFAGDISVIEGVMGLYDGMGVTSDRASSYHLAKVLRSPVILVVDAKGMGGSVLAVIRGFLSMDTEHLIRGVILNRIPETLCRTLKPMIEQETGIRVFGFFPQNKRFQFESRHLGLQMPEEIRDLEQTLSEAADTLEKSVDVDEILSMAGTSMKREPQKETTRPFGASQQAGQSGKIVTNEVCIEKTTKAAKTAKAERTAGIRTPFSRGSGRVRIGIARDRAFCFYYNENIRILESLGAEPVYFSPLSDAVLPENLDGLLLGGGYPELFTQTLSANTSMRSSIRQAVQSGLPTVAECGGFMYLHEHLITKDGNSYPMAGVIQGEVSEQPKLVRFGYISLSQKGEDEKIENDDLNAGSRAEFNKDHNGNFKENFNENHNADPGTEFDKDHNGNLKEDFKEDYNGDPKEDSHEDPDEDFNTMLSKTNETGTGSSVWIPEGETIRGHEFHYFDSTDNGEDCLAVKPVTKRNWSCVHVTPTAFLGFPHLYYASCPAFAENFIRKCIRL